MRRVTLRSLWSHKRRLVSTIVAILLGVAFMSGTFVFADTMDRTFDDLFAQANEEVDAQVQGEVIFSSSFGGDQRSRLAPATLEAVRGVEGVAAAEPYVASLGFGSRNRVIGADGDPIGATQGPPTILESWIGDDVLNPFDIAAGRPPAAADELAINVAAARDGDLEIGRPVEVVTQFGPREYRLVGTFRFGDADSSAGAVSVAFTLAEAQRLAGIDDGTVSTISARATDGVSPAELVARIAPVLPDDAEVITGDQAAAQISEDVQSGFSFFEQILTIFGGIALLVGTFIISNTFSILVAQRTRELALLRAVGAGRAQILRSVLLEALVVGVIAALLGLVGGVLLALGVRAAIEASGGDFPSTGLVISGATVVRALLAGIVVTAVAAVVPAVKATRVPPLAALRDVAIDRSAASRWRLGAAIVLLLLAVLMLSRAWTSDGDTDVVPVVGMGAVLAIIGAITIGPVLATPTIRLLSPVLPRLRGITGRLAVENAARNPRRTSATAAALVIGVALVGFITVFAASAKKSVDKAVERGLRADLVVQSEGGFFGGSSFPSSVADTIAARPDVAEVSRLGFVEAEIRYPSGGTARQFVTTVEPATVLATIEPRMEDGSMDDLADGGVVADRQISADNELAIGDRVTIAFSGGGTLDLEIQAISDDVGILGFWTITRADYVRVAGDISDFQVFVNLTEDADLERVATSIERSIDEVPSMEVLDRDGFAGDLAAQLNQFVTVLYALLGLSIVIALIGIGNTISLSVHERTRELGLLRAVGMERSQLRSSIRWEAVVISLLGTLVGLVLAVGLSYALVQALEGFDLREFELPIGSLAFIVVLAALFGVLASLRPARRAAKLDVLRAIATEEPRGPRDPPAPPVREQRRRGGRRGGRGDAPPSGARGRAAHGAGRTERDVRARRQRDRRGRTP